MTEDAKREFERKVRTRMEREHKRIIEAIAGQFGIDRKKVEETVRGRFRGVLSEAKA